MKRLMMYLKDYKKESILAPLFKLLEAFFELLVPLVMANIIDYGISNRNMGYIGKMGLLLLLLCSGTGFVHYCTVFRSQGGSGIFYQAASGIVQSY